MDKYNLIPALKDKTDGLLTRLFGKEFHSLTQSSISLSKRLNYIFGMKQSRVWVRVLYKIACGTISIPT